MKIKKVIKLLPIVVALTGVVVTTSYFLLLPKRGGDRTVNVLPERLFGWKFPVAQFPATGPVSGRAIAYSDIRDPGGVPQGLPVRLQIPVIGVDTAIEDALITPDGRMDVPAGSINVSWFALGPHPGKEGSAVIGGHFGIDNGVPKVFYNLNKLKVGDKAYVVDDKGDTLAFIVRSIKSFDRNADSTSVFTSSDGLAHLNIITCEGVWNQVNDSYPERLVVFTDAIAGEGPQKITGTSASPPKDITTITPVPAVKEKIATLSAAKSSPISPQLLVRSAKSLYQTPTDGLITSLLLMAIAFVGYKTVRNNLARI